MAGADLKEFTDDNFQKEVIGSSLPTIVDFNAPWCGPCKILGPIIDELAKSFAGKVNIGQCNVDDNPQVASRYGVVSIPTLLFVKNGSVMDQHVGLLAKEPLRKKIEQFMTA